MVGLAKIVRIKTRQLLLNQLLMPLHISERIQFCTHVKSRSNETQSADFLKFLGHIFVNCSHIMYSDLATIARQFLKETRTVDSILAEMRYYNYSGHGFRHA